jgi:adenosyl cobinamide kinase/adenosyl cobinamide phosphate guanylyltransferase
VSLVVFTGGVRSGKSAAAQELARTRALDGTPVVVATFGDTTGDPEMALRIARHQADRPREFDVLEATDASSWLGDVPDDALLLVDCLGTLISRLMADLPPDATAQTVEQAAGAVVSKLVARSGDTIVVTNEVGDGVVPAYASGRTFRDVLGRSNRTLVNVADASYLVVCGRLVDLGSAPVAPHWPAD